LWPKLGRDKFSICPHLSYSRIRTYRKDEKEARKFALVDLAMGPSYQQWETVFLLTPGLLDHHFLSQQGISFRDPNSWAPVPLIQ
jgi:hypothetical protein